LPRSRPRVPTGNFYTNIEGEAINRIYQAVDEGCDGLVMNPAGFTYAGFALKDCIKGGGLPYVEVHISSIAKRNIHCVLSDVAEGMITGFGIGVAGWACRIRTGESVRELCDWNCLATSAEVGARPPARPFACELRDTDLQLRPRIQRLPFCTRTFRAPPGSPYDAFASAARAP
jgi:hypothetical protein